MFPTNQLRNYISFAKTRNINISLFFVFLLEIKNVGDWGRGGKSVILWLSSTLSIQESIISSWKETDFMPQAGHKSNRNAIA